MHDGKWVPVGIIEDQLTEESYALLKCEKCNDHRRYLPIKPIHDPNDEEDDL